jgi:pimeloyl-ACP methyl ester carboxylesterase
MKILMFVFGLLCSVFSVKAQADFVGSWKGKIAAFNLTLILNISEKDGKLSASMDSPDQGAKGIPCDQVVVNGNNISISVSVIGANFNGNLSADKKTIDGKFNQGGGSFDLVLGKGEMPAPKEKPQTPVPPFNYKSEDVEYDNADKTVHLAGTLTYPSSGSNFPAAILISGSGQQDRDESIMGYKPFAVIADRLTKLGFAVLRVDDRGMGKSTGEVEKASSADFAKDVITSLEYLKGRKEIDKNKLGLIGHSEGGLIASVVAAERKDINFVILLAGPGINGAELLAEQGEQLLLKTGVSKEAVAAYTPLYKKMIRLSIEETDSLTLAMKAYKAVADWKKATPLNYQKEIGLDTKEGSDAIMQNLVSGFSAPWMKYFLKSEPSIFLEQVSAKVLALNGEKDIQVIASSNTEGIKKALQKSKSPSYEVKVLAGLNHLFQRCNQCSVMEYGTLEETFSEDALKEITQWLQKNVLQ